MLFLSLTKLIRRTTKPCAGAELRPSFKSHCMLSTNPAGEELALNLESPARDPKIHKNK